MKSPNSAPNTPDHADDPEDESTTTGGTKKKATKVFGFLSSLTAEKPATPASTVDRTKAEGIGKLFVTKNEAAEAAAELNSDAGKPKLEHEQPNAAEWREPGAAYEGVDDTTEAIERVTAQESASSVGEGEVRAAPDHESPEFEPRPGRLYGGEFISLDPGAGSEFWSHDAPAADNEPRWRSQPQIQHQGRNEQPTAPSTPDAPNAPGAHESPAQAAPSTAESPEDEDQPFNPARSYRESMDRLAHDQQFATKRDVESAVDSTVRKRRHKWLDKGIVLGSTFEHRQHKERERQLEQESKQERKTTKKLQKRYEFGAKENERQQAETSARLNMAENRYQSAQARMEQRTRQAEQIAAAARAEVEGQERLEVPAEHVVQTSAWHSIETDANTGRLVENQSFQYGHAFHAERAKELAPQDVRSAAAGGLVIAALSEQAQRTGTGSATGTTTDNTAASVPQIPNATMQGPPPSVQPPTQSWQQPTPATQQSDDQSRSAPTAPLWPWVVALIVVLIGLMVALN